MKRFFLLFCTAVLVCSIVIIPAFASEVSDITIDFVDGVAQSSDVLFPGAYRIVLNVDGNYIDLENDTFEFSGVADGLEFSFDFSDHSGFVAVNLDLDGIIVLLSESDGILNESAVGFIHIVSVVEDAPVTGSSPLSGIFDVFGGVGSWIVGQLGTTTSLFWNGQGLTFLGVLAVAALALAVILLLVFIIVRFLRFRG